MSARRQKSDHDQHFFAPRYPVTVTLDNLHSQAAQADSATEFDTLFQEHWPRVYGILFRIVGEHDEAQDLALEAFLKLYSKMDRKDGLSRFKLTPFEKPQTSNALSSWLYRVATNLGLNALRARKRREQYELEAGKISLTATASENPAEAVERAEEQQRVRKVLSQMKPRSAKILILRHSGLSYKEIAAAIRVSPNSVGQLLSRAETDFEKRYRALEGS
jgi:RNA polymerase sigma-70 factor (ECF subfamily)